jgi:hypothetical protein
MSLWPYPPDGQLLTLPWWWCQPPGVLPMSSWPGRGHSQCCFAHAGKRLFPHLIHIRSHLLSDTAAHSMIESSYHIFTAVEKGNSRHCAPWRSRANFPDNGLGDPLESLKGLYDHHEPGRSGRQQVSRPARTVIEQYTRIYGRPLDNLR